MNDASVVPGVAVATDGERIAAVGPQAELERTFGDATRVDCRNGVLTPGLVDSHTHAIFGKPRFEEQELRASGLDYMEIARRGGGIHSSVRDLRARTEDELLALAGPRLERLAATGVTTVEVKSGYGLTPEDELKSLRVIARLGERLPMRLVPTWLGAHEIPLEFRELRDGRSEYVRLLVSTMLPCVASGRLSRFADLF
jgi:imidazolonepropionase